MEITRTKNDELNIKFKSAAVSFSDSNLKVHREGKEDVAITGPGEYEVEGIRIYGFGKDPVSFLLEGGDFKLALLSQCNGGLKKKHAEELTNADVLLTPAGTGDERSEVTAQIQPAIVLVFEGEAKDAETITKLKLKSRGDLPEEEKILQLEPE